MKTAAFCAACLYLIPLTAAEMDEVRVRLQRYVEISPSALGEAKAVASSVLGQAGVRIVWADCSPKEDESRIDSPCWERITPQDLHIRIIGEEMARRAKRKSGCMGYAILAGDFSSIASAYFHRAVEMEGASTARRGKILGAILAHEIGHLLGVASHSRTGVMRGDWSDGDAKSLERGQLWFTPGEAKQVAANVARRARAAGDFRTGLR